MATPRKLPSGRWNLQLYDYTDETGKRHYKYFTADTKAEVVYQGSLWQTGRIPHEEKTSYTLGEAIDKYIELSKVLEVSTLSNYKRIRKNNFQSIMDLPVSELTDAVIQNAINLESKRITNQGKQISPKTVKNAWGLALPAVKAVYPQFSPRIKLPRYQRQIRDYPEPAVILNAIRGTDIELPCIMAMWLSFTVSELKGLKYKDIKDGFITIHRTNVHIDGYDYVKERAKTATRLRRLKIPKYIADLLPGGDPEEYIIKKSGNSIYCKLRRILKNKGIDHVSVHDLRHYSASIAAMLNVPEKYILERGGWSTPHVMKSVYQNTYESGREAADAIIDTWFMENMSGK